MLKANILEFVKNVAFALYFFDVKYEINDFLFKKENIIKIIELTNEKISE